MLRPEQKLYLTLKSAYGDEPISFSIPSLLGKKITNEIGQRDLLPFWSLARDLYRDSITERTNLTSEDKMLIGYALKRELPNLEQASVDANPEVAATAITFSAIGFVLGNPKLANECFRVTRNGLTSLEQSQKRTGDYTALDQILSYYQILKFRDFLIKDSHFVANIGSIIWLETLRPGSAKVLRDEFNIHHFDRYIVPSTLVSQFDNRDSNQSYGALILPVEDWNNAYFGLGAIATFVERMIDQVGALTRIYECSSHRELAEVFLRASNKQSKLRFLVAACHGNQNLLQFGSMSAQRYRTPEGTQTSRFGKPILDKNDLLRLTKIASFESRIDEAFEPDAPVLLIACFAGKKEIGKNPIAQTVSQVLKKRVMAHASSGYSGDLSRVSLVEKNGRLRFEGNFLKGSRVFVQGRS